MFVVTEGDEDKSQEALEDVHRFVLFMINVVDPELDPDWIRIQEGKNSPKK
jgi:hypothetical protein